MTYWKFLRPTAISPFSGYAWPGPDQWQQTRSAQPCVEGFHACRLADLPYWLMEELWEVELSGQVVASEFKVVASRARLVRQVTQWTADCAAELVRACVERVAHHAGHELRAAGLSDQADRLDGWTGSDLDSLAELATTLADDARQENRVQAARLCGYVGDAVYSAGHDPVASVAYIAARCAAHRSGAGHRDPFAAERSWQATWLAERLNLQT
jgi:hypothetical protein